MPTRKSKRERKVGEFAREKEKEREKRETCRGRTLSSLENDRNSLPSIVVNPHLELGESLGLGVVGNGGILDVGLQRNERTKRNERGQPKNPSREINFGEDDETHLLLRICLGRGVLSENNVLLLDGRHGFEDLDLRVSNSLAVKRRRSFHGEKGESLEHVVLADVSNHSELVEVASSTLGSEGLG